MAKTKHQKQQEAIARNRANFPRHQKDWAEHQPGGRMYAHEFAIYGKEEARKMASQADIKLVKAATDAHVDRHGNPLEFDKEATTRASRQFSLTDVIVEDYEQGQKP